MLKKLSLNCCCIDEVISAKSSYLSRVPNNIFQPRRTFTTSRGETTQKLKGQNISPKCEEMSSWQEDVAIYHSSFQRTKLEWEWSSVAITENRRSMKGEIHWTQNNHLAGEECSKPPRRLNAYMFHTGAGARGAWTLNNTSDLAIHLYVFMYCYQLWYMLLSWI